MKLIEHPCHGIIIQRPNSFPQRNSIHSINNNKKSQNKPQNQKKLKTLFISQNPRKKKKKERQDVRIHKSKQHKGRWGCGNRLGDRRFKHSVPRSEPRWEPASMGVHSQGVRNRSHTACPHHRRLLHHHSLQSSQRGPQSQSWLLALPHVPPSCLYVSFTLKLWFFLFFLVKDLLFTFDLLWICGFYSIWWSGYFVFLSFDLNVKCWNSQIYSCTPTCLCLYVCWPKRKSVLMNLLGVKVEFLYLKLNPGFFFLVGGFFAVWWNKIKKCIFFRWIKALLRQKKGKD